MNNMLKENMWSETYPVRFYEVGVDQKLSVSNICNFIQNSSANHISDLGVGLDDLNKKNHTWILSRLLIRVKKRPLWQELVELKTWQVRAHKLFAIRDYTISDNLGNNLVQATGSWLVIDLDRRRPVPCNDYVDLMNPIPEKRSINKFADKVSALPFATVSTNITTKKTDIDMNGHVNNVKYIEWFFDNMEKQGMNTDSQLEIEINYLGESFEGESLTVNSFFCENKKCWLHSLTNSDTNQELCRARVNYL